jgi:biopolymer transport protein ExbB
MLLSSPMNNMLDQVNTVYGWFLLGGPVMWPLLFCSVLSWAVILERTWSLVARAGRIVSREFVSELEALVGKGDFEAAIVSCRKHDSMMARVLLAGLRQSGQPHAVIREAVEDAGRRESFDLERFMNTLSSIAVIAPMLGFLGTVIGMIQTFQTLSVTHDYGQLSKGIYVALITTAGGLIVAIPSYLAHRLFVGLIDRRVRQMEDLSLNLINALDRANEDRRQGRDPEAETVPAEAAG